MKIYVFGSTGMLGRYVAKYLKGSIGINRDQVNALVIRGNAFYGQMRPLGIEEGDVIINCMGITNKRSPNAEEFLVVNALFTRLLADYCELNNAKLIHISTDCVYSGSVGYYKEDVLHDEENIYGLSKSVGEPLNCTVIRTSIIGENKTHSLDLLEWVRSARGGTLGGYTNHLWNGITCLQFAKVCEQIITENLFWKGVRHVFSPEDITKGNLVRLINEVYELGVDVRDRISEAPRNMTLRSNYSNVLNIPSIRQQLIEQRDFEL